jgi:hypothetical protein
MVRYLDNWLGTVGWAGVLRLVVHGAGPAAQRVARDRVVNLRGTNQDHDKALELSAKMAR